MLEGWDPLVVLMIYGIGCLLLIGAVCAVLYFIVKHAVCAGIKLAAAELRTLTGKSEPD
jgi:hypothetical protein